MSYTTSAGGGGTGATTGSPFTSYDNGAAGVRSTPFSELHTALRHSIIELKSVYGLSNLRDVVTTASGGTVTATTSEFQLDTDGTAGSRSVLDSAEIGRYVPGLSAEAGIGVRTSGAAPSGNAEQRWGYFDDDNGYYFGRDAAGLFIRRRSGGVDAAKVAQADWNIDKLDGTGPSQLTLDTAHGNIFQIRFAWYGYGVIEWVVVVETASGLVSYPQVVHRERVTGQTSIENPNLPLRAELDNNGTGAAQQLFVAGRQFSIYAGSYTPNTRQTPEYRQIANLATSFLPLVSFRRKAAFPTASVKAHSVDMLSEVNGRWELRSNMTLVNESWGTPSRVTATETSLEVDVAATAASGGEMIAAGLLGGDTNRNRREREQAALPAFDLVGAQPLTLIVAGLTGTNQTISASLTMQEEW